MIALDSAGDGRGLGGLQAGVGRMRRARATADTELRGHAQSSLEALRHSLRAAEYILRRGALEEKPKKSYAAANPDYLGSLGGVSFVYDFASLFVYNLGKDPRVRGYLVREIMSTASQKTIRTAEEFAGIPDDGQRRELVLGAIRMMSPAGGRHGKVALRLGALLLDYVQAHDLGDVFAAETGFLLTRDPDTVRAPDVAFVSRERIDTLDDLTGFVPLAPDLVAEVISPTDTFSHVEEKTHFWLQSGVHVVVIVDPENRTVRVVRGWDQGQLLDEAAELVIDDVIPGWRLNVVDLFT